MMVNSDDVKGQLNGGTHLLLDGSFGVLDLESLSCFERAFAPLPFTTGQLVQDPDFSIPSLAGPISWRLFYYSCKNLQGLFGKGRRASFPLTLRKDETPDSDLVTITLDRENGLVATYISEDGGETFAPKSPRLFDTLEYSEDENGYIERRIDTGNIYRYSPEGMLSSIETPAGQTIGVGGGSITGPYGQGIVYQIGTGGRVQRVLDSSQRNHTFGYDNDLLKSIEDPEGYITTFGYNSASKLTTIKDPNGNTVTYIYDTSDRVLSRTIGQNIASYSYSVGGSTVAYTDVYGKIWTTTLDADGNVTTVTDPVGAKREAIYNSRGLPEIIKDAEGRPTTIQYNSQGREISRQEFGEGAFVRSYDTHGNMLTSADPYGNTTTYLYGDTPEKRQILSKMDPLGRTTSYTYYTWGGIESTEDHFGFITTYQYDDYGQLTEEINPLGAIRTYTFNRVGNLISEIDEEGRETAHLYDGLNHLTATISPIGAIRTNLYDGIGNVIGQIDPLGFRTTYSYDAHQNEVCEIDAQGHRTTTIYDKKGRELSRIDANGNLVSFGYDAADRRVLQRDPKLRGTITNYDKARRVIGVTDPSGLTYATVYDQPYYENGQLLGHATAQVAPGGFRTTTVYDLAGRLIRTIDTAGIVTKTEYDALGRVLAIVEATGARTTTLYDIFLPNIGTDPQNPEPGYANAVINALGHRSTSVYDRAGHLRFSIDPGGRVYATNYDRSGLPIAEYSSDGTWVVRGYDTAGRNISTADNHGNVSTTIYDLADRVVGFMDDDGNQVQDFYNAVGMVEKSVDRFNNVHQMYYDPAGRLTGSQSYQGATQSVNTVAINYDKDNSVLSYLAGMDQSEAYAYDSYGRYTGTVNAYGQRNYIQYDYYGRLLAETDPAGVTTRLVYDNASRWAAEEYSDGYRFTVNFDQFGREIGYTDELGYITTYALDLLNRPYAVQDPLGYLSTMQYDALGQLTHQTDPLGRTHTTTYDAKGNLQSQADALGYVTTYHYDNLGRLVSVENALGYRTTTHYDARGRVDWVQNALGNESFTHYDNYGRVASIEDALGNRTTTIYDWAGRAWASVNPLGYRTTTEYDALGRVAATIDALGHRSTTVYDNAGRAIASVDALGHRMTTLYDGASRVVATIDALGFRTSYTYNSKGQQESVTNARGFKTYTLYDPRGYQLASIDALGYRTTTHYDGLGRVSSGENALGIRTTNYYDPAGQLEAVENAKGYRTTTVYDLLGRPLSVMDALGQRATTIYDPIGQVIAVKNPKGYSTSVAYDPVGNRVATINGLGIRKTYVYDVLDRLIAKDIFGSSNIIFRRMQYSYDAAGQLEWQQDAKGQRTEYVRDARGLEKTRIYADGQRASFNYDALGRVVTLTDALGLYSYAYDALGRVSAFVAPTHPGGAPLTYEYDELGNRRKMQSWLGDFSYRYDERNQVQKILDPGYESLAGGISLVAGGTTAYAYDALGRLIRQDNPNKSFSTYTYDALGLTTGVVHSRSSIFTFGTGGGSGDGDGSGSGNGGSGLDDWIWNHGRPPWISSHIWDNEFPAPGTSSGSGPSSPSSPFENPILNGGTVLPNGGSLPPVPTPMPLPNGGFGGDIPQVFQPLGWDIRLMYGLGPLNPPYYLDSGMAVMPPSIPPYWEGTPEIFAGSLYEYDALGRPVWKHTWAPNVPDDRTTYAYDALNQLASSRTTYDAPATEFIVAARSTEYSAWQYDNAERRVRHEEVYGEGEVGSQSLITTFIYDHLDQLNSIHRSDNKTIVFSYDLNGSRISRTTTDPVGRSGALYYKWDAANRLIRVTVPGSAQTYGTFDTREWQFKYTIDGLRAQSVRIEKLSILSGGLAGHSLTDTTVQNYAWDGNDVFNWRRSRGYHQVAVYLLDWANEGYDITINVKNTETDEVLSSHRVQNLNNGLWLVWNIHGSVSVEIISHVENKDALISAILFDGVKPGTPLPANLENTDSVWAGFVKGDTTTKGTWQGTYGSEGGIIFGSTNIADYGSPVGPPVFGSYISVFHSGALSYYWSLSTTDVRALQFGNTRIAGYLHRSEPLVLNLVADDVRSIPMLDTVVTGNTTSFDMVLGHGASGLAFARGAAKTDGNYGYSRTFHTDRLGTIHVGSMGQGHMSTSSSTNNQLGNGETFARTFDAWGKQVIASSPIQIPAENDGLGLGLSGESADVDAQDMFGYLGALGYWSEPSLGLQYVRARWLDNGTGTWLSVDPVDSEPRYSYAHNSPTVNIDPDGTQAHGKQNTSQMWNNSGMLNPNRRLGDFFGSPKLPDMKTENDSLPAWLESLIKNMFNPIKNLMPTDNSRESLSDYFGNFNFLSIGFWEKLIIGLSLGESKGMSHGFIEGIISMFPAGFAATAIRDVVLGFVNLLEKIANDPKNWGEILKGFAREILSSFTMLFKKDLNLPNSDRGYIVGSFLVAAVCVIATFLTGGASIPTLGSVLKSWKETVARMAKNLRKTFPDLVYNPVRPVLAFEGAHSPRQSRKHRPGYYFSEANDNINVSQKQAISESKPVIDSAKDVTKRVEKTGSKMEVASASAIAHLESAVLNKTLEFGGRTVAILYRVSNSHEIFAKAAAAYRHASGITSNGINIACLVYKDKHGKIKVHWEANDPSLLHSEHRLKAREEELLRLKEIRSYDDVICWYSERIPCSNPKPSTVTEGKNCQLLIRNEVGPRRKNALPIFYDHPWYTTDDKKIARDNIGIAFKKYEKVNLHNAETELINTLKNNMKGF